MNQNAEPWKQYDRRLLKCFRIQFLCSEYTSVRGWCSFVFARSF